MESIKKDVIVDVTEILKLNPDIIYSPIGAGQTLLIPNKNKDLIIRVQIADSVFEWFVDICDNEQNIILSTWLDHYDDTRENLKKEMNQEVFDFIKTVTTRNTRLNKYFGKKTNKELIDFQFEENGDWKNFEIFA